MRTTVDISPDLLDRIREQAAREGISFRRALNQVVHRGLAVTRSRSTPAYLVPTFTLGAPRGDLDLDKALALADSLAESEAAREIAQRK